MDPKDKQIQNLTVLVKTLNATIKELKETIKALEEASKELRRQHRQDSHTPSYLAKLSREYDLIMAVAEVVCAEPPDLPRKKRGLIERLIKLKYAVCLLIFQGTVR